MHTNHLKARLGGAAIILAASLGLTAAAASAANVYTGGSASAGAAVFATSCSKCHGANLGGGSAPALLGASIKTGYKTPSALYDFIKTQMPEDHPNTLSTKQYMDVTAFILAKNSMTGSKTKSVDAAAAGTTSIEIIRAAPPTTKQFSAVPGGAPAVNVSDAMMHDAAGNDADWLIQGRTYDNQRYSTLTQIDATNIDKLTPVALVQTGITASFETTPVVVKGVMYLTTPVVAQKMKIMAVKADTGERIWETTYNLGNFQICCGPVNRGPAVAYGMVYSLTLDNKLIALDAATGKLKWQSSVADSKVGYSETMAPIAHDGKIIIGSAGGEWAIRGFVAAYDAHTGKQVWKWNSTDPKTYAGNSYKSGGGMVWTTPALDTATGSLIFSTGNPNPDLDGGIRKGDNLYTDSIVALDVNSGKLKWYYQEVKHDVWDYDAVSPVVLFDVDVDGKTVHAAGEAGKVGWFFIVNRDTGKLIRKSDPYVLMSKNMFSQPTHTGVVMLPGANGGAEWSPPAYSPKTHYAYVLGMDQRMNFATEDASGTAPGHIRLGSAFTNTTKDALQDGRFVAIDTQTGKIAWTAMTPQPLIGGALVTASNLAFMGEGNGDLDAFDAATGKKLWKYNLGAGVNAPPITYTVNGVQYIAVAAGGNFQLDYPLGDTIAIFRLPQGTAAK